MIGAHQFKTFLFFKLLRIGFWRLFGYVLCKRCAFKNDEGRNFVKIERKKIKSKSEIKCKHFLAIFSKLSYRDVCKKHQEFQNKVFHNDILRNERVMII